MLYFTTNGQSISYAQSKNARFTSANSNIRSIEQRWNETYNSLPISQQELVDHALSSAIAEFKRRNLDIKQWKHLLLAEAKQVLISEVKIDGTMQRQLDIFWVLKLLNQFMATMVVPIQVYRPVSGVDEYLAWDGQHTIVLLWIIATKILGEDPANLIIPVNLYHSNLKAEMRANFISLNSKEGKKQLELIDIFEQQVFGVRVDGSKNPIWLAAEAKQKQIEKFGLFVTSKKFGDDDQPGAITRLQEINRLNYEMVGWLCEYLAHSTKLSRAVEEKEMVMMAHFFERCWFDDIPVDSAYIAELASLFDTLFDCDFRPEGPFWVKARIAYVNWHSTSNSVSNPSFKKEPVHGFPFLIAQLSKSFGKKKPRSNSNSNFWPDIADLF